MNYTCILKDNEKYLRGVATMDKSDLVDEFSPNDLMLNQDNMIEYEQHLASLPLISIYPEHIDFFEVGKEYEERSFELVDIDSIFYAVPFGEIGSTTPLSASPVVEDTTPVLFANWISDNQFTRHNYVWTSTKIHYSGTGHTTEQLYKLFEQYNITKK